MAILGSLFEDRIKKLEKFRQERVAPDPAAKKDVPKRIRQRWAIFSRNTEKEGRLRDLAISATRLETLMATDGWMDILEAKMYLQAITEERMKIVSVTDRDRFQASVEWSAIEGFFREISLRVKRGREAREELDKLYKKS